jgi:4-hydroxy-3-methylbut-2-enyl diphosphate reductase
MGVRRAMDMADAALTQAQGASVYAMGPLIHNHQAMKSLINRGLMVLEEGNLPADLSGASVIIRAHGITPQLEQALTNLGATLIDATCPRVKAGQLKARDLSEAGCAVFLAGEADHEEVIGLKGYVPGGIVVQSRQEAAAMAARFSTMVKNGRAKTVLIGQTTISEDEYAGIAGAIRRVFPALQVIDTICPATRDRQDSLRDLTARVDAVIVAGSRESANTRRLLTIAQDKPAWLVETPSGIPEGIASYTRVGLCAGASTPDFLIDAIEAALEKKETV